MYLLAIIIGAVVAALILGFWKKDVEVKDATLNNIA